MTVRLSSRAIELEPVVAEALTPQERERRRFGSALRTITRRDIEVHSGSLSDILAARVPGITVDRRYQMSHVPTCLEFRRPATLMSPGCHPPLVILDGVRISFPNLYLTTVPTDHIESVTVVPASMAGVQYGTGAAWGVLRIETRRPGIPSGARSNRRSSIEPLTQAYDWGLEPAGHPWPSAIGGAALGTLGGLAIALGMSGDCSPLNTSRATECTVGSARLASIAAFTLPVAGGALGANLLGRTERSRGRIVLTAVVAVAPMFMGYFFATPKDRVGFAAQQAFGRTLVVAGVPIVATLADRMFRRSRTVDP